MTLYAPSGTETYVVPRSRLVRLVWSHSAFDPGRGRSPSALSGAAGQAAARSEARLKDHASTPVSELLTVPERQDPATDRWAGVRSGLGQGGGAPLLIETNQGGGGDRAGAPARDWKPESVRPSPSAELVESARDSYSRMLAACGLPPALGDPRSDGTSQREALRRARLNFVQPMLSRLEDELQAQVDPDIRLKLDSYALDMISRSQVVAKLTAAGVELSTALSAVGLMEDA